MYYSIPYLILIFILGFLSILLYQKQDQQSVSYKKICFIGIAVFFLFFGFRGFIFTDWVSYYYEFERCSWSDLTYSQNSVIIREPGYLLLMNLCKTLYNNYHFFICVNTAINTILLTIFFKKYTDNILFAFVIYLVFWGFVISANLVRNATAIFIFLNSISYLHGRNLLRYIACCLLAMSFHFSAIVYLPIYFFFNKRMNKWVYLAIFISSNIIFLLHVPIITKIISLLGFGGDFLQTKLEYYGESSQGRGIGIGFIERIITGGLIFCYYEKLCLKKINSIFINAITTYFVITLTFNQIPEMGNRIGILFIFSYWVLWIELRNCFAIKSNQLLFLSFVTIYCILKTATTINGPIYEYDNILLGKIKSYQERKYIFDRTFEEAKY